MNSQIRDAAQQYLKAANLLHAQGAFSGVLLPSVVNAAFSIELHLKALNSSDVYNKFDDDCYLITAKPNARGHSFESLFNGLPPDLRDNIEAKYAEEISAGDNDFLSTIKKYSQTFVSFRYIFEDSSAIESMNLTEFMQLANFMGSYGTERGHVFA